jgi:hypothetical protein
MMLKIMILKNVLKILKNMEILQINLEKIIDLGRNILRRVIINFLVCDGPIKEFIE